MSGGAGSWRGSTAIRTCSPSSATRAVRPHVAVPRPRVGDAPSRRLRRAPDPRRLVPRHPGRAPARCTSCSTCAATGACRCAGPRPATPPPSAARTTRGPTATTVPLVGVPFQAEAYGGDSGLDESAHGLISPPGIGIYRGMVFANLDPLAPPLEDAIGDFRFYLDLYLNQSVDGVPRCGVRSDGGCGCNWKIGAENFAGDSYHTPHTHAASSTSACSASPPEQAQGGGAVLRRPRRRHHVQAAHRGRRREPRLRRLPARDGRAHAGHVDAGAAGDGGPGPVHGVGRHAVPEPQLRAQLAQGAAGEATWCRSSRCGCGSR